MTIAASPFAGNVWIRRLTGFILFFCLWYAGAIENTMSANLKAAVPAIFMQALLLLRVLAIRLWQHRTLHATARLRQLLSANTEDCCVVAPAAAPAHQEQGD